VRPGPPHERGRDERQRPLHGARRREGRAVGARARAVGRDASRRSRSIARLRAVVMIQPAVLGGSPAAGRPS